MSGVFVMSLRSLSQKHHVRDLAEDAAELRREQEQISLRVRHLQDSLHREASADASGARFPPEPPPPHLRYSPGHPSHPCCRHRRQVACSPRKPSLTSISLML
ncbi:hypothetical protein BRADI_1g43087v3 [Brachypodium distachyon]|uniref:Uncharacterized protein n=1 Tax=Brachypodium distachyon TaxID=15368 RepID=A0A0Q3H6E2_BRADI|nr:hypothetical protein BRADI_1g43087v3 [Brachypodium distachyon]